jgi:RES domain-containing protein
MPGAIIPHEWNFALNPAHPNFEHIRIDPPAPFAFDPRFLAVHGE